MLVENLILFAHDYHFRARVARNALSQRLEEYLTHAAIFLGTQAKLFVVTVRKIGVAIYHDAGRA